MPKFASNGLIAESDILYFYSGGSRKPSKQSLSDWVNAYRDSVDGIRRMSPREQVAAMNRFSNGRWHVVLPGQFYQTTFRWQLTV